MTRGKDKTRDQSGRYLRIAERMIENVAKGDFQDFLAPLDFMLLDWLPAEGTTFGGLYPLGENVETLAKKIVESTGQEITTASVGSRLTSMKAMGCTMTVKTLGKSANHAWQATARGKGVLAEWHQHQQQEKPSYST